jgi:hypothetical protein
MQKLIEIQLLVLEIKQRDRRKQFSIRRYFHAVPPEDMRSALALRAVFLTLQLETSGRTSTLPNTFTWKSLKLKGRELQREFLKQNLSYKQK